MKLTVTKVSTSKSSGNGYAASWKAGSGRLQTRVYFSPENETVMENFLEGRHTRPVTELKKLVPAVLAQLGFEDMRVTWSVKAGCGMCPCSPGFIITPGAHKGSLQVEGEYVDISATYSVEMEIDDLPDTQSVSFSQKTGRSPAGRLRNFKAMTSSKLTETFSIVSDENNDEDALSALRKELWNRELSIS